VRDRPGGRREVVLGVASYAVALAVRAVVTRPAGRRRAARNARRVAALERRLGIDVEPALQRLVLPRRRLLATLNVTYVAANIALTFGWLGLMWRRREPRYRELRTAVAGSMAVAQAAFLVFPCSPPRSLPHFVDTIFEVSGFDLDGRWVARLYNPLAAMPSLHMTWAVVTAAGIAGCGRHPAARAAAVAYPPAVAGTVLVTANHFLLDVAAGSALGAAALAAARRQAPSAAGPVSSSRTSAS
jgi:PAP2 superfamily protein